MTITWPTTLPRESNRNDYTEVPADTSLETSMDSGISKKRRRYTKGIDILTAGYILTAAEWRLFKEFFSTTTASGSLPFLWPAPFATGLETVKVRIKKGSVKMAPAGVDFHVTFSLDVLP